jgi:membrane-associated phospholipid phosphatase
MRLRHSFTLLLAGCAAAHGAFAAAPVAADVVLAWNARVLAIAEAEDGFLTLKGVRTAAMMHVAMHDALNAVSRRFAPYTFDARSAGADPMAAAAQAAYAVAVSQYPGEAAQFQAELERSLSGTAEGPARTRGMAVGTAAARAILERREGDGWDAEARYAWQPMGPGVYAEFDEHSGTPKGFVFGAGWAGVRPFLMRTPSQFRSPPPPAIGSDAYVAAYDEVKEAGRFESATRTPDQSHLAMWWKEFVEASHNRLARELAPAAGLDPWKQARLFALLNMAILDAYVASFDSKFFHNHWRPYTAIRWAAHDGNPRTVPDEAWDNLHRHTYAFPSYPSAHGTACAAAMTVLADSFGEDRRFTMTIPLVDEAGPGSRKIRPDPVTRSFDGFPAAALDCALSRVYLGIHFRYDSVEGVRLGTRIARFGLDNALAPARR